MAIRSVEDAVRALTAYGERAGLIDGQERGFAANLLFDALDWEPDPDFQAAGGEELPLENILGWLLDDAVARGVIEEGVASRDLFDTRLMAALTPRPGEVTRQFWADYRQDPALATDRFYRLSRDSDYIRAYRVRRDRKWQTETPYGTIDVTINLSKPEKDPKAIAAALSRTQASYPKCQLCAENLGYRGRLDHPARQTLRMIPLELGGGRWYFQYSPYVYYNEHCIVLSAEHAPMRISRESFARLLEFVGKFPHYILGSNADLPIVGGSILTHDHYQGGRYSFAMARAGLREKVSFAGFPDVEAGIVNWPMSVLRLSGKDPERLTDLADRILTAWRGYSDPSCEILAFAGDEPHNTITPIARMREGRFELDLVLRNNRTTAEHPLGLFHPHQELHHIKKENIGLIEVMGLAVLPARLESELARLAQAILSGEDPAQVEEIATHADWAREVLDRHPEFKTVADGGTPAQQEALDQVLRQEVGLVFAKVLEHCGVFKDTPAGHAAFRQFITTLT